MRILLIHSFWHPRGGDTTSLQIQREALLARGHEVVAFGARHPDNLTEPGDAAWPGWREARPAGAAGMDAAGAIWSLDAARSLRRLLAASPGFDVAHVHHLHRHLTPSILPVLRARGVPVVWTLHDYELTCPTAHHYRQGKPCFACDSRSVLPALKHGCTRSTQGELKASGRALHAAGLVLEKTIHRRLAVTDRVRTFVAPSRYLMERVAAGVDRERIVHLPNPVRAALQLDIGGSPRSGVLFAGRMVEEKGVLDVITLARALPTVAFTLLGDGPLLSAVRASHLPNVHAPGAVPRSVVAEALGTAAAVVVPSRWPENDPYAVTEAQAAGAPVLASRIGGIPEQIDDGVDGLLCPAADPLSWVGPLVALLADAPLADGIRARARERVLRERNPEAIAIALETLYRRSQ